MSIAHVAAAYQSLRAAMAPMLAAWDAAADAAEGEASRVAEESIRLAEIGLVAAAHQLVEWAAQEAMGVDADLAEGLGEPENAPAIVFERSASRAAYLRTADRMAEIILGQVPKKVQRLPVPEMLAIQFGALNLRLCERH